MSRAYSFILLGLVACDGGSSSKPDATTGIDGTSADARVADAPPDAPSMCPQGRACLRMKPVDGVTALPAGRIAVVWVAEGNSTTVLEIAYDMPWTAAPVTEIDLSQLTAPTAAVQSSFAELCAGGKFAPAVALLSTDPDSSGSLTIAEIENGQNNGSLYGLHQEVIAWFEMPCAAEPPDFPEGFMAGIHVYTEATPVHLLDGMVTDLSTCAPGTTACEMLDSPL